MASPTEHRTKAEELLALGLRYPHNSAARVATLTEAQVHATLYAAEITALAAAPQRFIVPDVEHTGTNYITQAMNIPLEAALAPEVDDHGTPTVPEVDEALKEAAKPARRTRKATTAKEAAK